MAQELEQRSVAETQELEQRRAAKAQEMEQRSAAEAQEMEQSRTAEMQELEQSWAAEEQELEQSRAAESQEMEQSWAAKAHEKEVLAQKLTALQQSIRALGSVAVAFSGGVDSTLLLKVAHELLGEQVLAVTALSPAFPQWERQEAEDYCRKEEIRQVSFQAKALLQESFRSNAKNRCYACKKAILEQVATIGAAHGMAFVAEGSNVDDLGDYRPGLQAVAELGVKSPLREAGLTKAQIRTLSKELGLPTWEKPSYACLASRFAYGEEITEEKLAMVEAAEQLLRELGFGQFRVRMHGMLARIELLPGEAERAMQGSYREQIVSGLKRQGFSYVTLDLQGYRTGSMNEVL